MNWGDLFCENWETEVTWHFSIVVWWYFQNIQIHSNMGGHKIYCEKGQAKPRSKCKILKETALSRPIHHTKPPVSASDNCFRSCRLILYPWIEELQCCPVQWLPSCISAELKGSEIKLVFGSVFGPHISRGLDMCLKGEKMWTRFPNIQIYSNRETEAFISCQQVDTVLKEGGSI